jgi:hypothetical protein
MNRKSIRFLSTCGPFMIVIAAGCGGTAVEVPNGTRSEQPLYVAAGTQYWTANQKVIPVCWQQPWPELDALKGFVKDRVLATWGSVLDVKFTGWADCTETTDRYVTVWFAPGDWGQSYVGMGPTFRLPSEPAAVALGLDSTDPQRRQYVAVHEFGHVLGFQDAYGPCTPRSNLIPLTEFDEFSIMACPGGGKLTDLDVNGAAQIYGYSPALIAVASGILS